jgi:hypothetical protein
MRKTSLILVFALAGVAPFAAQAASLDEVTMQVMDAHGNAGEVTQYIEIPAADQALLKSGNRSENADAHAQNTSNPPENAGPPEDAGSPDNMDQHASDAIEGSPAAGRRGGPDK